jgi:hypothetical protein
MFTISNIKELSPLTSLYQIQFDKKFKYDQRYIKTWIRTTKFFKKRRGILLKKKRFNIRYTYRTRIPAVKFFKLNYLTPLYLDSFKFISFLNINEWFPLFKDLIKYNKKSLIKNLPKVCRRKRPYFEKVIQNFFRKKSKMKPFLRANVFFLARGEFELKDTDINYYYRSNLKKLSLIISKKNLL